MFKSVRVKEHQRGIEPQEGLRRHKLMPEEIRRQIPALGSQESFKDPIVYVKFFTPYMSPRWRWYATEFDGHDRFFGYVVGSAKEWGYFSLRELGELERNGFPLIERDKFFVSKRLSEALKDDGISMD